MTADHPIPDTPIADPAAAVKEAIAKATNWAWNDHDPRWASSGAERYVTAARTLMDLETAAGLLLARLHDHDADHEPALDNETRELASRVLSSIPGAIASLIEVDDGIAEIFYPGLSGEVLAVMGPDARVSYFISRMLNNASTFEARADAARNRRQGPRMGEDYLSELEERSRIAPSEMSYEQQRQESLDLSLDQLFQKMREHPRLDVTRLAERFRIEGVMSGDLVAELEALLSVLSKVRSQVVTVVRDNWSLRDVVEPPQPEKVKVTVGDVFANVSNSVIATRKASIEWAVSNASPALPPEVADALRAIGEHVANANDGDAASDFDSLARELAKPKPDKSRLRARWDALVSVLPGIMSMTDAVAKIMTLF